MDTCEVVNLAGLEFIIEKLDKEAYEVAVPEDGEVWYCDDWEEVNTSIIVYLLNGGDANE